MQRVDPGATQLAEEFLARPRGPHSEALRRLLNLFRGTAMPGKHILVFERASRRYRVAQLGERRGDPVRLYETPVFENAEDGERFVFRLRWKAWTGCEPPGDAPLTLGPAMDAPVKGVLGYCDPLSVAPGETVRFMVSCERAVDFDARLVRLICADSSPGGPGYKEEAISSAIDSHHPGVRQTNRAGSCMVAPAGPQWASPEGFTVQAWVWPTMPECNRQAVVACWSEERTAGWGLFIDPEQGATLLLGTGDGKAHSVSTGKPLAARQWYLLTASYDATSRMAHVVQRPLRRYEGLDDAGAMSAQMGGGAPSTGGLPLTVAACVQSGQDERALYARHFNGKIEAPRLYRRALRGSDLGLAGSEIPAHLESDLVAAWDFARDIPSDRAVDLSPNRFDGRLINVPTRGVTGHDWSGATLQWSAAPSEYAAIHFHEDDLVDAGWAPSLSWAVPTELRSGFYALHVSSGGDEDYIPFFVRAPRDRATAPLAFLVPTATYLAYANYLNWADAAWIERLYNALWAADTEELTFAQRRELGASLYDTHLDGTGVIYSSWRRPILNLRPKLHLVWTLNADSHIVDWLEAKHFAYDIITDHDLQAEGVALLNRYRAVLTGTHPEYYSREMLDAMDAYLEHGGRLVYTGGNGFYWRIAFRPGDASVIEVRKSNGSRNWFTLPGEGHHSFDGSPGGIWRELGRAPNRLVGVGFTACGVDSAGYYVRRRGSFDPRARFIFEEVGKDERIGDFGSVGGGAAGLELDRVEPLYGTPPHALVLASSEGHSDNCLAVLEDQKFLLPGLGGAENPAVRADMVFLEAPCGGAVFSTGSISWAGSLAHNGYDNNVSRIMENVVRRFLDPAPFQAPHG